MVSSSAWWWLRSPNVGNANNVFIADGQVNGGWNETIYSRDYGWNTKDDAKVNSTGPAAYRIYSETAFAMNAISWRIYCAQNDCTAGKRIVCWDGFQSTLNKVNTGQPITAALANQQRLGYE